MMKKLLIVLLLVPFYVIGQEDPVRISKYISLEESYTIDNYQVPDEIIFFTSGHYEYEFFYRNVFDRINQKSKKQGIRKDFVFQDIKNWKQQLQYYNKTNFKTDDEELPIVCFYEHDRIDPEIMGYCKDGKCEFFFYVTLVDVANNQVLLKRKYRVKTRDYYYTQCKNLGDELIKELKI